MGDTIDHDPLLTRSVNPRARGSQARGNIRLAFAVLAVVTGCNNGGSLVVTVTHPTGLAITSTTVSVYVSNGSNGISCQDIEYGNLDAAELAAAQVASETIDSTGTTSGNLDGIPRVGTKLVVALGYDDNSSLLAGGCSTVGTISGTTQEAITTEVAATLSLSLVNPDGSGSAEPYQLQAIVTAPDGEALDGRQVWWRAYGAAGSSPSITTNINTVSDGIWEPTQPQCASGGATLIDPVPPADVGGFEVEVRVAWGVDPPQYFAELTKFDLSLGAGMKGAALNPPVIGSGSATQVSDHICERRTVNGQNNLVCLSGGTTTPTAIMFSVTDGVGYTTLAQVNSQTFGVTPVFALIGVDNGSDHDVYAVGTDCSLSGVFGSSPPSGGASCAGTHGTGADDVVVLPSCDSTSAKIWMHYPDALAPLVGQHIRQVDLGTQATSDFFPPKITNALMASFNNAGCVTELDPRGMAPATLVQVAALDYGLPLGTTGSATPTTHLVAGCSSSNPVTGPCDVDLTLPIGLAGVGFVMSGTESHVVTTTEDVDGIELSQDVLLGSSATGSGTAGSAATALVERSRQPTAAEPSIMVAGNFDVATDQDLLWTEEGKRGTTFQIAYTRVVNGGPLSAVSQAFASVKVGELEVGTFGSGSNAQIAVFGSLGGLAGVSVIPTGVAPEAVTLPPYMSCPP